jgi:adenylate cyclase
VDAPELLVPTVHELSVFFSDMQDSTPIAEALGLERFRRLRDEYIRAMADVIGRHDGVLIRTIGDAIMALWNVPRAVESHAARCCAAAADMQATLDELNASWTATGYPRVVIRMGLNSGLVMVGNFGSSQRVEYDAQGDEVNLAARLEGLNKQYGTRTIVSDATRRAAGDGFVFRELDVVRVVGRKAPVVVHELLRGGGAPASNGSVPLDAWTEALTAYRARAFDRAVACFEALVAACPADGPSRIYLARAHAMRAAPPPSSWDGVHDAKSK